MATKNLRSLPPNSEILFEDVTVTDQHVGCAYLTYPASFDISTWYNVFNNGAKFKYSTPWGNVKAELLDQWYYSGFTRSHHPTPKNFYDPATGRIGSKTMADWLYILDFWYNQLNVNGNRIKMMWVIALYEKEATKQIWIGYAQDTAAGEDAILGYCNALFGAYTSTTSATIGTGSVSVTMNTGQLLTSLNYVKLFRTSDPTKWMWGQVTSYDTGTGALVVNITNTNGTGTFTDWSIQYCSALGFTLAEHPTLARVEISNERWIDGASAAHTSAYARACRIVSKIFKKYKPTIQIQGDSSDQGKFSFASYMMGDAVSISGNAADGDLGTGMQACDYVDGQNQNNYTFNIGTVALHNKAIADNMYPHFYTRYINRDKMEAGFDVLTKYNVASKMHPLHASYNSKTRESMVICMGETSMLGASTEISPSAGFWAYWLAGEEEAFENLIRDYLPKILYCATHGGTAHMYVCDGAGGAVGTQGAISKTSVGAHSGGQVKLTLQNNPQYAFGVNGAGVNIQNMSVVIAAGAGGWADLGLAAAEKGEFTMSPTGGGVNEVYLHNTTYTGQPANDATYTEFQIDWNTRSKALKRLTDLMFSAPNTYGLVHHADKQYAGIFWHVKDTVTYYLKADGSVSKW